MKRKIVIEDGTTYIHDSNNYPDKEVIVDLMLPMVKLAKQSGKSLSEISFALETAWCNIHLRDGD